MLFLWSLVSASETTAVWHYHRHCTLQHCYRVTSGFNGRCQNSTHSTHPYNPLTYQHQNWHTWLCPPSLTRCEIWIESVHGMLHYKYVKYKDFVKFSFTFLSFFILVVAYSNKMPRYHRDHRVMRPIYDCPENNVSAIIPLKLQHLRSQKSAWRRIWI